jgi:hypothetical protein
VLVRLVAVDGFVTPDPAGRMPGRGAHLHPELGCLDLALRRKAFPRAFRLPGPLDAEPVRRYLHELGHSSEVTGTASRRGHTAGTVEEAGETTMTAR